MRLTPIAARPTAIAAAVMLAALTLLGHAAAEDRCVHLEIDAWTLTSCIEDADTASWIALGDDNSFWIWTDGDWQRQSTDAADALAYLSAIVPTPETWNAPHPFYDRDDWESFPLARYHEAEYDWAFYAPTPEALYGGPRQRDHLVALAEAHQSGGAYWPDPIKAAFALDSANIFWLPAAVNAEKWAWDPADWRPAHPGLHQPYAIRWIQIKRKWALDFDEAEIAALRRMLRAPPCTLAAWSHSLSDTCWPRSSAPP